MNSSSTYVCINRFAAETEKFVSDQYELYKQVRTSLGIRE
jgi:hypothetical protein